MEYNSSFDRVFIYFMISFGVLCTLMILAMAIVPSYVNYNITTTKEYKMGFTDYPDDSTYKQLVTSKEITYIYPDGITRYCLGYEQAEKNANKVLNK
jgi:hypothetical protein